VLQHALDDVLGALPVLEIFSRLLVSISIVSPTSARLSSSNAATAARRSTRTAAVSRPGPRAKDEIV
jgi:hypothetical protein